MENTVSSFQKSQGEDMAAGVDTAANYKCLRNPEDGSMYYGEVAYIRRSNGQLIKTTSPVFETEIKPMAAE